jgi:hypothetical protein
MSDVPGKLRAGFMREAREMFEEAMGLCERAELLRDDVARPNHALAIAADGQTLELLNHRRSNGDLIAAIDRFYDAAWELGQTTWSWAQRFGVEESRRGACPVRVDAGHGERVIEGAAAH